MDETGLFWNAIPILHWLLRLNQELIRRHNKKAWMTTVIMLDWLTWFDKRMQSRKTLLLTDGFSAHKAAVRTLMNGSLKNTRSSLPIALQYTSYLTKYPPNFQTQLLTILWLIIWFHDIQFHPVDIRRKSACREPVLKVTNELSGDGWRRQNYKWLELPAGPPRGFEIEDVSLQSPRNSHISLGLPEWIVDLPQFTSSRYSLE